MTRTAKKTPFAEAKSRSIQPVRSVYDFQKYDQVLIKSGGNVTRKIVRDINFESNSITATDAQGQNEETITLNPNSPAMDGGEFKYWIDESKGTRTMPNRRMAEEDDTGLDDLAIDDDPSMDVDLDMDDMDDMDDMGEAEGDGEARDDTDADSSPELAVDADQNESEAFALDMQAFLNEDDAPDQVPDNTVGGGVDDTEMADNDGEDVEDTPAPHDTTGMEDAGDVNTMAGDRSSNGAGAAPEDEVETHGDVGGPETIDNTLPTNGEHEPGTPDKSESISEAVRRDVDTALSLVIRGADPAMLAPRLLRGAG